MTSLPTSTGPCVFPENIIKFCVALIAAIVVLAPAAVIASADGDQEQPLLIVIRSGRIAAPLDEQPGAVTVVEPDTRTLGPEEGLGEFLDLVPGSFASSRYNGSQDLRLSLRGFGARGNFGIRGIRILLDGFPLTLPDGQSTLDELEPSLVQRAEVRRGPTGAAYGSAAGGVISLETADAFSDPGEQVMLGAGGYGAWLARGQAGLVRGDGALRLAYSSRGASGYRDHAAQLHHRLNLRYQRRLQGSDSVSVFLSALDSPHAEDPGGLTAGELKTDRRAAAPFSERFDTGEEVRQVRVGARWSRRISDDAELRLSAYGLDRDFANRLPFSATRLDRAVAGTLAELELGGGSGDLDWRWVGGLEADRQGDRRQRFENDAGELGGMTAFQDETVTSVGLFSELAISPVQPLTFNLGLRGDRLRVEFDDRFLADGDDSGARDFSEISASAGFTYRIRPRVGLFARVGSSFEVPTTTELANPTGDGGFNPDLEPQRALGTEAGLRWEGTGGAAGELALFHTDVRDQLVQQPIPGFPDRFFFVNAGESRYRGVELSIRQPVSDALAFSAAATWGEFEFRRFSKPDGSNLAGNRVPGIPDYQISASLEYRPIPALTSALKLRRVGARYTDDENTAQADAFTVLDLRVGWERPLGAHTLRLAAGVDNLLDETYEDNLRINAARGRYFEPAPERSVFFNVGYEF